MLCPITFLDLGSQTMSKSVIFCALRVFKYCQDCNLGAEVYYANQSCSTPAHSIEKAWIWQIEPKLDQLNLRSNELWFQLIKWLGFRANKSNAFKQTLMHVKNTFGAALI